MGIWWIYAAEEDEEGMVIDGDTPEEAFADAIKEGWDPNGAEVWAYPLGELYSLGRRDKDGRRIDGES